AGIDLEMDRRDRAAGRQLGMPVGVISQDWGSQLGFDATDIWGAWAPDLTYQPSEAGHFMAEAAPDEVSRFVRRLLARWPAAREPPGISRRSRHHQAFSCRYRWPRPDPTSSGRSPAFPPGTSRTSSGRNCRREHASA